MNLKSEDLSGISADEVVRTVDNVVSRDEVEAAVRKLIQWAGDDPDREGLLDTPKRVVKAFEEFFSGYAIDPTEYLERTFEETDGYDEMIVLRDISFISHCEHHILPVVGKAHVAYLPERRVVGISKLARVVEAFAKRLQIQERMTAQIANAIKDASAASRYCRGDRGRTSMHDDPWCHETGCLHGDEPDARRISGQCEDASGI